jgi:nucleotide-binding universal stress UspA family protein
MGTSSEHLEIAFRRAATVADRAVGLWLAGNSKQSAPVDALPDAQDQASNDLLALRALARAAATAYARQLRAEGLPPERMLVLVKQATSHQGFPGFGAQQLTNDIVRWSIEAYFDE